MIWGVWRILDMFFLRCGSKILIFLRCSGGETWREAGENEERGEVEERC